MTKKKKISSLLLEKKLANSKSKATALVMEGRVKINGKLASKSGTLVDKNSQIEIIPKIPYVSRGGVKLEKVFYEFNLDVEDKNAIDIGSSTGGFTDFLLKKNVKKVVAIDVGYGKLSWKLRNDPRVVVLERTNVRYLSSKKLPFLSDFTVVDVSFISIKKIFKKILDFTRPDGEILILIKPQFEVSKEEVENKGIIRSKNLHYKVLLDMVNFISNFPVRISNITFSRITGAKGNIEYWIYLVKSSEEGEKDLNYDKIIGDIVKKSHKYFSLEDNFKWKKLE